MRNRAPRNLAGTSSLTCGYNHNPFEPHQPASQPLSRYTPVRSVASCEATDQQANDNRAGQQATDQWAADQQADPARTPTPACSRWQPTILPVSPRPQLKKRANRDTITIMPDASKYFVVNTQGAIITRPKTGQSTWQSEHTNAEIEQTLLDFGGTNQNFHKETRLSATERINIIGSTSPISVYAFRTRLHEQVNPYSIVSSSMEYTNGAMVLHYTSSSSKPGGAERT